MMHAGANDHITMVCGHVALHVIFTAIILSVVTYARPSYAGAGQCQKSA